MNIDPRTIQRLREATGAGIMDCRRILEEADGDFDKAVELLRKAGQKVAAAKSSRETKEGLIHAYVHANGSMGALVEVSCETDFVARNEDFQKFVHNVAMQVVATNPIYLTPEDVPQSVIEKEREIYFEQMAGEMKPEDIKAKIIEGKLAKYFQEVCLMKQLYMSDDSITVEELLNQQIAKTGENIQIKRFSRFAL